MIRLIMVVLILLHASFLHAAPTLQGGNGVFTSLSDVPWEVGSNTRKDFITFACSRMTTDKNLKGIMTNLVDSAKLDPFKDYRKITCLVSNNRTFFLASAIKSFNLITFMMFLNHARKSGVDNLKTILETRDIEGRTVHELIEDVSNYVIPGTSTHKKMKKMAKIARHFQDYADQEIARRQEAR